MGWSWFGEFARKIRIANGEQEIDMAFKLGVSTAKLNGMESGDAEIPPELVREFGHQYKLSGGMYEDLVKIVEASNKEYKAAKNGNLLDLLFEEESPCYDEVIEHGTKIKEQEKGDCVRQLWEYGDKKYYMVFEKESGHNIEYSDYEDLLRKRRMNQYLRQCQYRRMFSDEHPLFRISGETSYLERTMSNNFLPKTYDRQTEAKDSEQNESKNI